MTRRVNYSNGQRVDLIDAMAEAEFQNQDLRRLMRQIIIGRDATKHVLWGFEVTPEDSGVSSKVLVKMDQGGGNIGAFMGAESYGGGVVDFGQLAGGKDAQDNLDGNAQALVDFIGQPVAVYEVKVRFAYVDAVQDNRAFWNPATNSEFIKVTNTRRLPTWVPAITGHAGSEWVLLAEVNWTGVSVATADVTDKRDFALEGPPRDELTVANRWSHEDQASATLFGVKDFDRGHDRADPTAIQTGFWQSHRMLARQIQDLKGPRESDVRFDAYSRPYQPVGFAGVQPDQWTKNLRSVDTVTYTVGDGSTDAGDFNGLDGLQTCFQFIETNQASLPTRIRIVVKSRENTSGNPTFTWDSNVSIANKNITLVGRGNGWVGVPGEFDGLFEGRTLIGVTLPAAATALEITGQGSLHLENINILNVEDNRNILRLDEGCRFTAKNCYLSHSGATLTGYALSCPSEGCHIENSIIIGRAYIGGKTKQSLFDTDYDSTHKGGLIRNTLFINCMLRLRLQESIFDTEGEFLFANRLRFQNCDFLVRSASFFVPQAEGMVAIRGAKNITFDQCNFQYNGDEDCVRIGPSIFFTDTWGRVQNIAFNECQFLLRDSATHAGWVSGAGGVNGGEGTGWAIKSHPNITTVTTIQQIPRGISIKNCQFRCQANFDVNLRSSPDAGAVLLYDTRDAHIESSRVVEWIEPVGGQASDFVRIFGVQNTVAGLVFGAGQNIWIERNSIGAWHYLGGGSADWGSAGGTLHCIHVLGGNQIQILNNNISAVAKGETLLVDPTTFGGALYVSTSTAVRVEGNHFILWRSGDDPLHNSCVFLDGINNNLFMNHNHFLGCGGYNIFAALAASVFRSQFNDNYFAVGTDGSKFSGPIFLDCTTDGNAFQNNDWDYIGPAPAKTLHVGTGLVFTFVGNQLLGCNIEHDTAGGLPVPGGHGLGYAPVGDWFANDVLGYT